MAFLAFAQPAPATGRRWQQLSWQLSWQQRRKSKVPHARRPFAAGPRSRVAVRATPNSGDAFVTRLLTEEKGVLENLPALLFMYVLMVSKEPSSASAPSVSESAAKEQAGAAAEDKELQGELAAALDNLSKEKGVAAQLRGELAAALADLNKQQPTATEDKDATS